MVQRISPPSVASTTSVSQEDYIKAIYHLGQTDGEHVSTKALADNLNIKSSSTTDMVKKLAAEGLIHYKRYNGVRLTDEGQRLALTIVRKHRLWETFLVSKLEFSWDEVHEIAEQLEHVKSPELIKRLDEFLGFPMFDPHGDPIPDENGQIRELHETALATLNVGQKAVVVGVKDHSGEFLRLLEQRGILIGSELNVLERYQFDDSMLVVIDGKQKVLSVAICRNLTVRIL